MKKNFKVLSLIAIGSSLVIGTVALSATGVLKSQIFPAIGNGETVTGGYIDFVPDNTSINGSTSTTVATTQTGGKLKMIITGNDTSKVSGYVGAVKKDSVIKFYEEDISAEYTFENLTIISFYYESGDTYKHTFSLSALYQDGTTFSNDYGLSTKNPRDLSFAKLKPVSNLTTTCSNENTARLTKVRITYSCTSKALEDFVITSQPTKTSYIEGESFDPTGLMLKAIYSNGSEVYTQGYSFSPSVFSKSDEYVTIYHGGLSKQIPVSITSKESMLVGTFKNGSYEPYYLFVLNSDHSGTYDYNSNHRDLTWEINDNGRLVLNKDPNDTQATFVGDIFYNSSSVLTTSLVISDKEVSFYCRVTFNTDGDTSNKKFTKQ